MSKIKNLFIKIFSDDKFQKKFLLVLVILVASAWFLDSNKKKELIEQYDLDLRIARDELNIKQQSHYYEIELLQSVYEEYVEDLKKQINSLSMEVNFFKQKQKTVKLKITHPDGKVEEREVHISHVMNIQKAIKELRIEYNKKIKQIEEKIKNEYEKKLEYAYAQNTLSEQIKKTEKSVTIERKNSCSSRFIEFGYMSNSNYYMHGAYSIFGPFNLGVHLELQRNSAHPLFGLGIGYSF